MNQAQTVSEYSEAVKAKAGKYLTFKIGEEIFGLEILKVQEINGLMKITNIPKTPNFIRGVINLRGKIIPVIDLRLKFEMASLGDTVKTCIIVVQVLRQSKKITMGILVDEVSEVMNILQEQIDEPPSFGSSINVDFIFGIGKVGQKVVMLLDIEKVLTAGEIDIIGNVSK
ncbi:MAG: CheW1 [uncultured bacterium]|nr:MAG: CheW1 [uncultured bacterium]